MRRVSLCLLTLVITSSAANMPLFFEPNRGQAAADVEYLSRGNGVVSYLNSREAVLPLGKESIHIRMSGARSVHGEALDPLPGISAYLTTGGPGRNLSGIPQFGRVRYAEIYPGIDLVYYGSAGKLEYDFVVNPGASTSGIRLAYDGATPRIDTAGNLLLTTSTGEIRQRKPRVYQVAGNGRREIDARYCMFGASVGIEVHRFDRRLPLVIDPILEYSSFLNYNGLFTSWQGLKQDAAGDLDLGGVAYPLDQSSNSTAVVTKYSPSTNQVLFSTVVVNNTRGSADSLDIDKAGNVYIAGTADQDTFVTKLAPGGQSVVYSLILPGTMMSVAADSHGNAYAGGGTYLRNYPVKNAIQPTFPSPNASQNALLTKLSPTGEVLFATLWGGSTYENAHTVLVDQYDYPYLVGVSGSDDFPTRNGMARKVSGGRVFVTKFAPDGQSVIYSSVFGGSVDVHGVTSNDEPYTAAVDAAGNVFTAGATSSVDFPVKNPLQARMGGSLCSFIAELNAQGTALLYSTYFGGTSFHSNASTFNDFFDVVSDIALGPSGGIFLGGNAITPDFPLKNSLLPNVPKIVHNTGLGDLQYPYGFVAKLTTDGSSLLYSTLMGGLNGNSADYVSHLAPDASGATWVGGATGSPNFQVTGNAVQSTYANPKGMGFLAKLTDNSPTGPPASGTAPSGSSSLVANPAIVRFSTSVGGQAPAAQAISVSSATAAGVSFSAAVTAGNSWLFVTPATAITPTQLTVSTSTAGLAPGSYGGTIRLTQSDGTSISLDVSLLVTPAPPVVTGINPAVVEATALNTVVTLTGSGFTSGAQATPVYMGYAFPAGIAPVTFVNSTTIKVTLPVFLLWQPGTLLLQVGNSSTGPWTPVSITIR